MTHYHFLDESGDPGLSGSAAASSHFALAMVQLPERAPLQELARVRQRFHFPASFEFKYHATKPRHKVAFFAAVRSIPFQVRAVVVDKSSLDNQFARMTGEGFAIEFITRLVMRASEIDVSEDVLVIDGATSASCRALRVRLSSECRRFGRVRPFAKIVGSDSQRDDGLQLADMIAGTVSHHVVGGAGSSYYETFASKVADLWVVTARRQ